MLQRSNLLARPCQPYTLGLSVVSASCADAGCAMVNWLPVTNTMVDIHVSLAPDVTRMRLIC
eukprot:1692071-Prymnesium_polylepis.1